MKFILLTFSFFSFLTLQAQDSIKLSNGDQMVGKIKHLDKGVLEVSTDYSESNFFIDWSSVADINTSGNYILSLASGKRITGRITMENNKVVIHEEDGQTKEIRQLDLVYLKSVDNGFWDRIGLSLDGGYTLSKANNNKQFTLRGRASYLSESVNPDLYFNFVNSKLDDGTTIISSQRNNWGINMRVFIIHSWFGTGGVDYLVNDEQSLKLRSTYKLGLGNFLIRNHKMYLSTSIGSAWNNESFSVEDQQNDSSAEGYISMDYHAFGLKGISISSGIQVFRRLTDSSRTRVNYNVDLKVDLPKDFYIGLGYTLNYDSHPVLEDITTTDYVVQTTVGWSL